MFSSTQKELLTPISSQCGHHLCPVVVTFSGTLLFNARYVNNDRCRCSKACDRPHRSWRSAVYQNATRFIPELNRAGCLQSGAPLRGNCPKVYKQRREEKSRWVMCIVGWPPLVWFQRLLRCSRSSEAPAAGDRHWLSLRSPPAETNTVAHVGSARAESPPRWTASF